MEGSLLNSIPEDECQDINPVTESEVAINQKGIGAIVHFASSKVVLFELLSVRCMVKIYKFETIPVLSAMRIIRWKEACWTLY